MKIGQIILEISMFAVHFNNVFFFQFFLSLHVTRYATIKLDSNVYFFKF